MTLPLPMPPARPPKVIEGKTYRWCRKCGQYKPAGKSATWDVCPPCDNSKLNESAMLPQHSHTANAARRRLKP